MNVTEPCDIVLNCVPVSNCAAESAYGALASCGSQYEQHCQTTYTTITPDTLVVPPTVLAFTEGHGHCGPSGKLFGSISEVIDLEDHGGLTIPSNNAHFNLTIVSAVGDETGCPLTPVIHTCGPDAGTTSLTSENGEVTLYIYNSGPNIGQWYVKFNESYNHSDCNNTSAALSFGFIYEVSSNCGDCTPVIQTVFVDVSTPCHDKTHDYSNGYQSHCDNRSCQSNGNIPACGDNQNGAWYNSNQNYGNSNAGHSCDLSQVGAFASSLANGNHDGWHNPHHSDLSGSNGTYGSNDNPISHDDHESHDHESHDYDNTHDISESDHHSEHHQDNSNGNDNRFNQAGNQSPINPNDVITMPHHHNLIESGLHNWFNANSNNGHHNINDGHHQHVAPLIASCAAPFDNGHSDNTEHGSTNQDHDDHHAHDAHNYIAPSDSSCTISPEQQHQIHSHAHG